MDMLRRGSRAPQVKLAQRLLNKHLDPRPRFAEDAIFGPQTQGAVKDFQRSEGLSPDGIVGPNTWRALGVTLDISHPVRLYGQPTNMTCWSAAATMLTGRMQSIGPGGAQTGPSGGLRPSYSNVQTFADAHGLRMNAPQSYSVQGLAGLMRKGPLWVAGWVPSGHAVVYGGIHGDGTVDGTLIVIYDPWPPGRGRIHGEIYGDWVRQHPTATTYILER